MMKRLSTNHWEVYSLLPDVVPLKSYLLCFLKFRINWTQKRNTLKGGSAKNTDSFPESGVEVIDLGEDTSLNLKNKMKITDKECFFKDFSSPVQKISLFNQCK